MDRETKRTPAAALEEAARRWGKATLLVNPNPQPTPEAPAAVESRRAA